ncbi:MAG: NAD-dependent malic enzyme [Acidimicrobiales bacterium]|nr:NAD-dependent malic enzyme [Acidimicrobiales bacterium]|tara:strand:+ start:260 stop:1660 length:1401 start_codon:yes stop_codon:yes gene_type:complete
MSRPTAAFSATLEVELAHEPGTLGRLCTAIGDVGGNIRSLRGFTVTAGSLREEVVVDAASEAHVEEICAAVDGLDGIKVISAVDRTFKMHEGGKLETVSRIPLRDQDDLSMAYTPGVARVCMAIHADESASHELTIRKNTVAIVSDGTAVLGLGDIGPAAAMPVMEGKALLFKEFAGVDAFPICLDVQTPEQIVETVVRLAPTFGGINLEDIAAPGAFEVEAALREALDIPVFHDDQHGTAVVALAALENAVRLTGKDLKDLRCVILGAGAAGVACAKILLGRGIGDVVVCDRQGAIYPGRDGLNSAKEWLAHNTNTDGITGSVADAMVGADVFMGLSGPGLVTRDDVVAMADKPIVFAMANPDPEILPEAIEDIAAIVATGRSDYPNQINNVLAFPGIFRGAFDARATDITEGMKIAAAGAIAAGVSSDDLAPDLIIPTAFDRSVVPAVSRAVAAAAIEDDVTRH